MAYNDASDFRKWASNNLDSSVMPNDVSGLKNYRSENRWYKGDKPTRLEMLGRIYSLRDQDPMIADTAYSYYTQLRNDPSSKYYSHYAQPTNQAVSNLAALGFDTNNLNDDWLNANAGWIRSNLDYRSGSGNTPSAPTKNSTWNQRVAYELNQYMMSEDQTKKAEQEYQAAINEVMFMAGNSWWNYSDDDIISRFYGTDDENFKKKYPTLYEMRTNASLNKPTELNRAVDFSDDVLYGAIWSARNPGKAKNIEDAMAKSYLGTDNVWKENPEYSAMLNPMDNGYLPYAGGATIAYDDALFFGLYNVPEGWLEENKRLKYYGTDEEKKHYANIEAAEQNWQSANNAADAVYGYVNSLISSGETDFEKIKKSVDTVYATGKLYVGTDKDGKTKYYTSAGKGREEINLDILNKMDASMGKNRGKENGTDPDGNLVPLSRPLYYKYDDLMKQTEEACAKNSQILGGDDTLANLNPENNPEQEREKNTFELIEENASKNVSGAMSILNDRFSDFESRHFNASPKSNGTRLAESFHAAKEGLFEGGPYDTKKLKDPEWVAKMATQQAEKAEKDYLSVSLGSLELRNRYEKLQRETEEIASQIEQIENKYGDTILAQKNFPERIPIVMNERDGFYAVFTRGNDGKYQFTEYILPEDNYLERNVLSYPNLNEDISRMEQGLNSEYESIQNAKARIYSAPQYLTLDDGEGNSIDIPFVYDKETGTYVLSPEFNSESEELEEYLENAGETKESVYNDIKNYANVLNEEIKNGPEADPDMPDEKTLNTLRAKLSQNTAALQKDEEAYRKAKDEYEKAFKHRNRVNNVTYRNSGLLPDTASTDAKLDYISNFAEYEVPQDGYITDYGVYVSDLDSLRNKYVYTNFDEADTEYFKKTAAELREEAKDTKFILESYPDAPYKDKMEQYAAWCERTARLYENYLVSTGEDFEKLASEGRNLETNKVISDLAGMLSDKDTVKAKIGFEMMTDFEKDLYYAIYARDGREAAEQFYFDIEEGLVNKAKANADANIDELNKTFPGRVFNEVASAAMASIEPALNVIYLADSGITGKGNPWLRLPSYAAKKANESVIADLKNRYKGTVWEEILPGGVEIVNNRLRSYVASYVYGGLIPDVGGSEFLNNTLHAVPIATIAFGEAYEEAIENNMEPWQAWTLGLVNFMCEAGTEGIKFGNYKSLFEGGVTLQSFKGYFLDKIKGLDWLEEATGETLNNILERSFNKWIGGDKSEHEKRKQAYIESGLVQSEEEAEIMVMLDYIKEDEHTAIISALGSFLDAPMFAVKKGWSTLHYANEAAKYNRNHEDSVKIRDLRNRDAQIYENAKTLQAEADKIRQARIEEAQKPFVPRNPSEVAEAQQKSNQTEYDVDLTILENSADSDQTTVTETIAAVLRVSDGNKDRANAAAISFVSRNGSNSISALQDMLDAGQKSGTNINTLKLGIQYAFLADGECSRVMASEEYQNATPEQQAAMLSNATQADATNESVQAAVKQTVHENRVAETEKTIIGEGAAADLNKLQESADEAAVKTYVARQELDDKLKARKAASDNVETVTNDFLANPSDENAKRKDQAEHELAAADAVVKEYEQHYQNMQDAQTKAESDLNTAKDKVMTQVRQEAENRVGQIEQQEAEAQQKIDESVQYEQALVDNGIIAPPVDEADQNPFGSEEETEARERAHFSYSDNEVRYYGKLDENMEKALTEAGFHKESYVSQETGDEHTYYAANRNDISVDTLKALNDSINAQIDEQTGKAKEDADLSLIDAHIEKLGLKGEQAEQLREKLTTFYHEMNTGKVDTSRMLTDAEAMLAINEMSRRLGVQIEVDKEGDPNALPEGKDGVFRNGKIILSHRLTVGQAMLETGFHEITHALKGTKSYSKYKDTAFSILYSSPDQLEAAIRDKIDEYGRNGVKLDREGAEDELLADFAKNDKTFANRDTINRMLDAGLGGKIRNVLHNINQYLKNAKLDGAEREKAENLRKAERLYIKAINERRSINTHPSSEQFSVNQFAQAAGLFFNEVNITDGKGNVLYGPGLYTADPSNPDNHAVKVDKVTPEMMENTPVGLLTNSALALGTMDHETVNKIHTMFADLMTMCADLQDTNLVWEIAGSTLYSEFSAIKANSDKQYSTTVDFGTICTKTQAVINQLSRDMLRLGRGLTASEILDVYNDVFKSDLKVPCPVCYVFSRWLGVPSLLENIRQYQNRFLGEEGNEVSLEETQRRVDEFINTAHNEKYNIDEKFVEAQNKARQAALDKIDRIKNGKNGIAATEAKIAKYRDQLAVKPNGNTARYLVSAEKKLAKLQEDLRQAELDYENSDISAYAKVINKKKADIEKKIKEKTIKIEGDDKGTRGINDDIRDAIKEGKPYDKLEEKRKALYAEIDELNAQLREVDAYNWVTQALCRLDENGRFVVDPEFKRTKNEVLLDLNRTGEFAKDTKNWTYRSTRGAGMGKAILPYSGAEIGDSVLGTGARTMTNPYEDGDVPGAFNALKSAIMKAYRQNMIGGQRFQSTSDFRPEWGLDYIMTFIEQQAIGSCGQLYTKVKEFVPLSASAGIDTNCSIMPYANGWHDPADGEIEGMTDAERRSRVVTFKDDNGNERTIVLDFSDVTGMEYDAARDLSKQFDSVQMIMVGINDIHIRACLAGEEIDFVIPWHASGNTKSQLQNMMKTVNETLTNSSDYTKTQTDQIADKKALETAHGKIERGESLTAQEKDLIHKEQMRDARQRLLTGATLTATDMERIRESKYLTSLYERFEGKTLDGKELPHDSAYWIELPDMEAERVKMTSSQAEQIFPYEYWDTTLTKDQADQNGLRFIEYCNELGLIPRFSGANQKDDATGEVSRFGNFSGAVYDEYGNITGYDPEKMAKGYWKLLIDRKMYDNNGNYRSQQKIDASKIRVGSLAQGENGRIHVDSNIPDSISGANYRGSEAEAKYQNADQLLKDRLTEKAKLGGKEGEQAQRDLDNIRIWETAHANTHEQYRVTGDINAYEDMTNAEMMQLLSDAGVNYQDAVNRGDMETAQKDVDFYAEQTFADSKVRDEDGNLMVVYHGTSERFTQFDMSKGRSTMDIQGSFFSPWEIEAGGYGENVGRYYLNIQNPASEGVAYAALNRYKGQNEAGKKAREYLISQGYDGVANYDEFIAFYPEQIKSADPVTYDDNGNVIPLSERFNDQNPDIRWKVTDTDSEMTPAEMLQLLRDAGIDQGEQAPTTFEPTGPQRQFGSETVQNAEGVNQTVKNWLKMHSDYNPDTNEEQIDRAVKWVMTKRSEIDPDGFWGALSEIENKNFNPLTADGQAKMYVLMSLASNKGRDGNIDVQLRIADAINKQGTTLGQALQARRLFRLMTPQGRLSVLQKEVDRVNSELKSKGKEGNVTLSEWILRAAAAAQTEEEFAEVRKKMWEELGSQLPVSWWDRFQAWRMLSMLGNVRTHGRNLVGNLMFVPAVTTKNKIGAALESIFVKEGERTKAFKANKAALEYADKDSEKMRDKLTGEGKYSDATQIQRNKKPFGKSWLGRKIQGLSDFSGDMLEKEDWIFLHYHYKHALAGWMTANNVTGEQLDNDSTMRDKARAYAIEEAQKATYRDANKLAEWLSKGDRIPGVRLLTTSVLPFKKTPMNILKRGLEYSPLGFLKNITVDAVRLSEYQKWATGKKAEKADWALSPSQFIDKISSGITGVGIAGLGAFMNSMGWLTLGFKKDEPEDKFKKAKGQQEYSLNIKLFGQDISYTIDWAAPACMPLFVGATIQEAFENEGLDLGSTLEALGSVTEPIWNLSMLDGMSSVFETSQYEDGNVAEQILMKIGLNYANSFIPTFVGQVSRTIDPTRRKTFVTSGSKPSAAYYTFEQIQNKTPFSVWNIPYRDYRGREDRRPELQRLFENMISPGYSNFPANDETLNEMERLYKANKGNENVNAKVVVPEDADKSFSIKGETIRLTDQQYDQLDVERKQMAWDLLDRLVNDPYYAQVDDTARIDMINDIWTYATQQAKFNQFPQFSREDWISRAQKNNIDILDVVKKRSEEQIIKDSITGWGDALIDSIKAGNQNDIDTAKDTLGLLNQDADDIEKIVKNGFRDSYIKAYKDNDEDAMDAIEGILYQAGFDFDYEDWLKTTIKNEDKWLEDYGNP